MVPSGATAGATFIGGRWAPQSSVGGTEVGVGGQGRDAPLSPRRSKVPGQFVEFGGGASGTRILKVTLAGVSSGVTFTSQALLTSFSFHGLPSRVLSLNAL